MDIQLPRRLTRTTPTVKGKMKKVYQNKFGAGGNCFQACIASIFELSLEEVPDFCNEYKGEVYYEQFVKWLNKRGFSALPVDANDDSGSLNRPNYKGCILMVGGKNNDDVMHSVIYKDGELVHNPNRKCKGIKPETIDIIFPLNPRR